MTKEALSPRGQWFFERMLVLAGVAAAAPPLITLASNWQFDVPVNFEYGTRIVGGKLTDIQSGHVPGGLRFDHAVYEFHNPALSDRLAMFGAQAFTAIVVIAVVRLLFLVVRSLRDGDPFNAQNAVRLRRAGIIAAAGGTVAGVVTLWAQHHTAELIPETLPTGTSYSVSWYPLVIGLVLLTVAEVFRRGAIMRDELDGVV